MRNEAAENLVRTLQVLVVGPSPEFAGELEAALLAATEARVSLRSTADFAEAAGASRARLPDVVCIVPGKLLQLVF